MVNYAEELSGEELNDVISGLYADVRRLSESLDNVGAMFKAEDAGWLRLDRFGTEEFDGLTLDDLREWSKQIRESIAGNPHMKRGLRLRTTYIWDGGIHYEGISSETRGRRGTGQVRSVANKINEPINQRNFFSKKARNDRESALYSDSIYIAIGNNSTKNIEMNIPVWEIGALYRNPDKSDEIWAYRRDWNRFDPTGKANPQKLWYFTDTFYDKKTDFLVNARGEREMVSQTHTAFDLMVNTQLGWTLGVPDALSALVWSRLYRDFLTNGKVVSDAMAQFLFQIPVHDKAGADNAGVRINRGGMGQTAITGQSNPMSALSTAGKVYDFDGGRPLAAAMATALEVSTIHLLSDAAAAGSSYGSAQTLDLPTRLAIEDRRSIHRDFDLRVLRWMGSENADAWFIPLIDWSEYFRAIQSIRLKWDTGLYTPEQIKRDFEGLQGKWERMLDIPQGVMLPNNVNSVNRRDVDPNTSGSVDPISPSPAPGIGQATGAGSGLESDDLN